MKTPARMKFWLQKQYPAGESKTLASYVEQSVCAFRASISVHSIQQVFSQHCSPEALKHFGDKHCLAVKRPQRKRLIRRLLNGL